MLAISPSLPAFASLPARLSASAASSATSAWAAVRGHGQWRHKRDDDDDELRNDSAFHVSPNVQQLRFLGQRHVLQVRRRLHGVSASGAGAAAAAAAAAASLPARLGAAATSPDFSSASSAMHRHGQ